MFITILAILGAIVLARFLGLDRLAGLAGLVAVALFLFVAPAQVTGIALGLVAFVTIMTIGAAGDRLPDLLRGFLGLMPALLIAARDELRTAWHRRRL